MSGAYTLSYQNDLTNTVGNAGFAPTTAAAATNTDNAVAARGKGLAVTDANFKLTAVEDLGGGLKASADVLFETGAYRTAALTRADSGVSLAGGFGTLAFRNTRSSDLIASIGSAAVSLPDGVYDSANIVARGAIDTLGYTSNEIIPGLRVGVTYVEGNDGSINTPKVAQNSYVLGASYTAGPLGLSAAYKTKAKNALATAKANMELAASYDLGVVKVAYAYDGATTDVVSAAKTVAYDKAAMGFSVTAPLGAVTVGANYFKRGDFKVVDFGAAYALSKRTTLGASVGKQDADQGTTIKGNQYRVRLGHTF